MTESSSDPELTLKVGETVGGDYVIVHADGTQQPLGEATPLGRGGAGDVYRAIYKNTHDRAIKFLTKRARREWPPQSERNFEWTFLRERIFLSRLSHGHIIRFYDRGTHRASNRDWEYLVTEYIDGTGDFRFELAQPDITGDECYQLITDILRALRYLHSIGIGHGDVMSNNIRCRHVGGDRQAVLLDLGTALQFEDSSSSEALNIVRDLEAYAYGTRDSVGDIELAKDPWFYTTYDNTHDVIKANVFKPVARADLRRIFPYHDLYFVGKLLQDLISVPAIADKLGRSLSPSGMDALKFMIDRLLRPPIEAYYKSMKDLYLDWDKLRHGYLAPADVPELSLAAEFKYSLATPAGRVVITPRLSKFVQHKLFQRLRDAPQLELLRLKYTGATHTRQEHSLLMLRNTRYYLAHLLNGPAFRFMVNKSELEATLLLSLLQGIGHYQLSHFFEDYAIEQRNNRLGAGSGIWRSVQDDIPTDRELFLAAFDWNKTCGLRGDYAEIIREACGSSCEELGVGTPPTMAELTTSECDSDTLDAILAIHKIAYGQPSTAKDGHLVLAAVLRSEIDADKVSYLKEDAAETGVRFGEGIDMDGLLGALRAPSQGDLEGQRAPRIGITVKGLAAVESILNSRNEMYDRVYWHHSMRSIAAMIKYCITRLLMSGSEVFSMPDYVRETFFMEQTQALRVLWRKYERIRDNGRNPISQLLDGERGLYRLAHITKEQQWVSLKAESIREVEDGLTAKLARAFPTADVRPGDLAIDIPVVERGITTRPVETVYVYEGSEYTRGKDLGDADEIIRSIRDNHIKRSRACRIYASRSLYGRVESEELERQIRGALED